MAGLNHYKLDIEIIRALSDETRIEILEIIGKKEMNVSEIVEKCRLSRPAISHHLQILKRAKILDSNKDGKEIYYSVNFNTIRSLSQALLGFINTGSF